MRNTKPNECTKCNAVCAERNNYYESCIGYREDENALWAIAEEISKLDPEHKDAGYFYGATYVDLERFKREFSEESADDYSEVLE